MQTKGVDTFISPRNTSINNERRHNEAVLDTQWKAEIKSDITKSGKEVEQLDNIT